MKALASHYFILNCNWQETESPNIGASVCKQMDGRKNLTKKLSYPHDSITYPSTCYHCSIQRQQTIIIVKLKIIIIITFTVIKFLCYY